MIPGRYSSPTGSMLQLTGFRHGIAKSLALGIRNGSKPVNLVPNNSQWVGKYSPAYPLLPTYTPARCATRIGTCSTLECFSPSGIPMITSTFIITSQRLALR